MNRPAQYHISDPVLPWVYSATEADAYFDHIEAELSACKERVKELEGILRQLLIFEDDHDAAGTEWHDAQKAAVEQARKALEAQEQREEEKG